jgi:hypothetical protein
VVRRVVARARALEGLDWVLALGKLTCVVKVNPDLCR